jgi:hypothetical protein
VVKAPLLDGILDALVASTDHDVLRTEIDRRLGPSKTPVHTTTEAPSHTSDQILHRIVLSDILDDGILGARPQDKAFPLRMLFADLGAGLANAGSPALYDAAFALAAALNFYFRASLDEEARVSVGIAISKLYYTFVSMLKKDAREVQATSPLLAALLSGELERSKLESVDHQRSFDGTLHDREPGSASSPNIVAPKSFLCRVSATGVVRSRALVRT